MSSERQDHSASGNWDSFSSYATVSETISENVFDAVAAAAHYEANRSEGKLSHAEGSDVKEIILRTALILKHEVEREQDADEYYEDVVDRWCGDDGWIAQLRGMDLSMEYPDWVFDFAAEMPEVAWRLGYLKAGERKPDRHPDEDEQQAREMLETAFESVHEDDE